MRPLVLAAGLLVAFAAPAAASPTWLAPQNLSIAPATGAPSGSVVASDAAGETFAAWDLTDGTNVRVQLASHPPGRLVERRDEHLGRRRRCERAEPLAELDRVRRDRVDALGRCPHQRVQVSPPRAGRRVRARRHDLDAAASVDRGLDSRPVVAVDAVGRRRRDLGWTRRPTSCTRVATTPRPARGARSTTSRPATNPIEPDPRYPTLVISPGGRATVAWSLDTDPTTHRRRASLSRCRRARRARTARGRRWCSSPRRPPVRVRRPRSSPSTPQGT